MARRSNLYIRKGVYYWRKRINGRECRQSTECRDRKAAERRAAEFETEAYAGKFGWKAPKVPTVGEWLRRYRGTYGRRKKDTRRDGYVFDHIAAWFSRPLDSIRPSDCVEYMARRRQEDAADGTIAREAGLIAALFNAAVKEGLVACNPWKGVPRPKHGVRDRVLSLEEQASLFDKMNAEYRRMVVLALGTGMRERELLGLRLHDVSEKTGVLYVRADTAKGGKAREIPTRPEVLQAIKDQAKAGRRTQFESLWSQSACSVRKYVKLAAEAAGIEHLCVHDLRRTFGTRCAAAGMPLAQLQSIMGHHSPEVTAKHYIHLQQNDRKQALLAVDLGLQPREVGTKVGTPTEAAA